MAQSSKCCFESSVALGTAQDLQEISRNDILHYCHWLTPSLYDLYVIHLRRAWASAHPHDFQHKNKRRRCIMLTTHQCYRETTNSQRDLAISMMSCSDYNTPAETAWDQLDFWTNKLHAPWYFAIPPDRIFWLVLISSEFRWWKEHHSWDLKLKRCDMVWSWECFSDWSFCARWRLQVSQVPEIEKCLGRLMMWGALQNHSLSWWLRWESQTNVAWKRVKEILQPKYMKSARLRPPGLRSSKLWKCVQHLEPI